MYRVNETLRSNALVTMHLLNRTRTSVNFSDSVNKLSSVLTFENNNFAKADMGMVGFLNMPLDRPMCILRLTD